MQELLYAAVMAFAIAILAGPVVIPMLRRMKFGQSIREEGPERHYAKAGTPTMGGVLILLALVVPSLIFSGNNPEVLLALFVTLGHGLIGFLDDFIKVVLKRSLGLKARQKLLGQIIMAVALSYIASIYFGRGTDLWIPVWGANVDFGALYYLLIFLVLVGTTNAVNLTDGLDGLAAGTTTVAALAYAVISLYFGKPHLALFCAALAGACLGFLRYNAFPAKVFMGDTGSLALGGALAAVAVMTKTEFLLVIVGGVFVIEALSVIIQVVSFKSTGKRVFKMSPIHHHFELSGWTETKVVTVFWLAGTLFAAIALSILAVSRAGGI
ncbi:MULTISPECIES: phospho-N-acetylmuramoyl-pentapeptide-transferase [Sporomusa]|jgi:phospho-N-acetylmuramoyl-pentapeptide-transferase|uniref:Phospho-N-acetylmuramoyl-pentapeptide-transferase n=1 Tax=Sporomusa sphaeroides DSM 2875 TaxID=1337886 RepID=A0ABM9VYI2_9FIRM|nr:MULTISPECIES: phospho-N-acetylmuramoyl-pentapeptide-transferase [Sporomusa]MCM0760323.1 phospho-N-acetylmuramoyl-pentapeptide-transferase [Sporomusa sphaeroides DSM 2875]OLS58073.1 phospho-N-acetylmuramoyl-pentapeptide-transferase [Sporomusa sphaeroides DSM 2875]CVK17740.1 Phospho-N-acetylmuramoyl-pentapeptide-transferase [Sporomusa sphaeroides DSM 2875]HML31407.1 phospho-N-acetylmuramoyl-pentapeptide-transferase [Sporomusa sphaeroides]